MSKILCSVCDAVIPPDQVITMKTKSGTFHTHAGECLPRMRKRIRDDVKKLRLDRASRGQ